MTVRLYDYWRSSAAYRVRIALNLKGLAYESLGTNLLEGDQRSEAYRALNPQGLVPMIEADGLRLTQSLAIIDWLDSVKEAPRLIPADPAARAQVMAQALVIAADIHPINNLRVLQYLKRTLGHEQAEIDAWIRHWIVEGLTALEAMAPESGFFGGSAPNAVDVLLVPQMYNARRFDTPLEDCPRLVRIDAACTALDAFARAHPDACKPD